jgi:hypothetical protein
MTRDELKSGTLAGCDRVLMLPRLLVGYEQRRLIYAQQSFWQTASDAELDRLLGLVPQAREEAPPPPLPIEQRLLVLELQQSMLGRQLDEIQDTLARLDPSPFSPRPQQRRDAMTAPNQATAGGNPFAACPPQLAAALAGFDWKSINWLQVLQVIQMILTQFQQMHATAQGAATPAGGMQSAMAGCDKTECLREHFNTIERVAACGVDCCDAP